jgi:hypothetical protein
VTTRQEGAACSHLRRKKPGLSGTTSSGGWHRAVSRPIAQPIPRAELLHNPALKPVSAHKRSAPVAGRGTGSVGGPYSGIRRRSSRLSRRQRRLRHSSTGRRGDSRTSIRPICRRYFRLLLRFSPPTARAFRKATWPDFELKAPATVFSARPPLRRLRVVIDAALLDAAETTRAVDITLEGLLAGLVTHPYISLLRYADEGPPPHLPRVRDLFHEAVDGWLIALGPDAGNAMYGSRPIVAREAGRTSESAVGVDSMLVAEADDSTSVYAELSREESRRQRVADVLAAQAAQAAYADLFITERPYLHAATWKIADGVLFAHVGDALPLVSLYLRTQGEYYTWRSGDGSRSITMNRGLFYWVGVRELLPAGWRWFRACQQHAHEVQHDQTMFLAQSLFQRLQRALQARDEVHRWLNVPQNNDTADAAFSRLDEVLLLLMAASDVSARVAHAVLKLDPGGSYDAGWQRRRWRRLVKKVDPSLEAVVADGTSHHHTLTILRNLRNSVHGEALVGLALREAGARQDAILVGLPHADGEQLVRAMDACGGREHWGIQQVLDDHYHADPGILVDQIFRAIVAFLDEVLEATPVERLDGVLLRDGDALPPDSGPFQQFSRSSIRWQLGL